MKLGRRIAAVGLLLAVPGLLAGGVAYPLWLKHRALDASIAQSVALLQRRGDQSEALRRLEATLADAQSAADPDLGFLSGDTDAAAAASLQDLAKTAVESQGGALHSLQDLPAEAEGEVSRVKVRIEFLASAPVLQRVFYDIETAPYAVFLDGLEIRHERVAAQPAPGQDEPALLVRADLYGYARKGVQP